MPVDLIIERISGATIGFSNLPLTRIVVVYASRDGDIYVLEIVISDSQWQTQIGFELPRVVDIMRRTRIALFINVLTINFFRAPFCDWLIVDMRNRGKVLRFSLEKYCSNARRTSYRIANRKNQLTNVDSSK